MILRIFNFLVCVLSLTACQPFRGSEAPEKIPDLPPGTPAKEYLARFESPPEHAQLQEILDAGAKNLLWLKAVNSSRPPDRQISISTLASTKRNGGVQRPTVYSVRSILLDQNEVKAAMPQAMREVIFGAAAIPSELPVSDVLFVVWSRRVNLVYEFALRWILLEPYHDYLIEQRWRDVRGYYFLSRLPNRVQRLRTLSKERESPEAIELRNWIIQMCLNNRRDQSFCEQDLAARIDRDEDLNEYFDELRGGSEEVWNSFFQIQTPRRDLRWEQTSEFRIPFFEPNDLRLKDFIVDSIEPMWRLGSWAIRIAFQREPHGIPNLEMRPGVNPHVDVIAGNRIVMDANQPIADESVQWVLSHEFGHVLGFKDCYLEFFEAETGQITNYDLDSDNIMCSRGGRVQHLHFQELIKHYQTAKDEVPSH